MINPWEEEGTCWETEEEYWKWCKGQLQKFYYAHPIRYSYINTHKIMSEGRDGRLISKIECTKCNGVFPIAYGRGTDNATKVFFKHSADTINNKSDMVKYITGMVSANVGDIVSICRNCHGVLLYMKRKGISFEDAVIEKGVIAFLKKPVDKQKKYLKKKGVEKENFSNAAKRKVAYRELCYAQRDFQGVE